MERVEDDNGVIRIVTRRKTNNAMTNRRRANGETPIYKTLHRKLKIEQREPTINRGELRLFGMVRSYSGYKSGVS